MPFTYDFKCGACGTVFERRAQSTERSADCPECGAQAARQFTVTSPARIRLWRERWEVTRSQVVAPHVRENWRGAALK